MLESKRLPRDMKSKCGPERSKNPPEVKDECLRLMNFVRDTKNRMVEIRREREAALRAAHQYTAQAKSLSDDSELKFKIGLVLDALGLILSGGTATAGKRAITSALNRIGTIFGLISTDDKIAEALRNAEAKMEEFNDLNNKLEHFEQGLQKGFEKMEELGCPMLFS